MPALDSASLVDLTARGLDSTVSAGQAPFKVICAWPVSGQYGPGSRILYYVLVAICVLARRADWLRSACLAAALLLPLIAALHGIVLATVHNADAVDLDIYGAFQCCAIGVLVAPVAATLSRTYFKNPGRNAIVVWSLLVVAGLISLTVEFYRVSNQPKGCWYDNQDNLLNASRPFPYEDAQCGLVCDPISGPFSSIRGGSADNIYVIPVPYVLTFNVCIMLTAACCIPAILLVAWMMVTSSHTNWTRRFGEQASLTLRVPVRLFNAESGMPALAELEKRHGNLSRIGIVGTASYGLLQQSRPSSNTNLEPTSEHNETAIASSVSSSGSIGADKVGIAGMLHSLHEKSALSVYDFEIDGTQLQVREMKLAAGVENLARQIYAALRDLENEDVDVICVQSVEVEDGTAEAKVMSWLRNEESAGKRPIEKKNARDATRTPGAVILLCLFGLAVLTILTVGERNLFSAPINYQTEPMANVGQWAPVAGTILVVAGSIYVLVAEGMREERRRMRADGSDVNDNEHGFFDRTARTFIRALIRFNDLFDAPRWLFDHSEFQKAQKSFPLIPGERHRNLMLTQTMSEYGGDRESHESIRSAATSRHSFTGSTSSWQQERGRSPLEPELPALVARKRTLTLPEVDHPSPRRRATNGDPPVTPPEPIVPHNPTHPTIVFTDGETEVDDTR